MASRPWTEAAETDEMLLRSFLDGDEEGIAALVRRYEGPLYAFLCRICGQPELAADLFQETFVRVVRHAGSFAGRSSFRTWLYSIATNVCRSRAPRLALVPPAGAADGARDRADDAPGPERRLLDDEVGRRVAAAVMELPAEQREVFVLKVYDELSFTEIAEVVGRPVGTTKSQMRAAVEKLRGALADLTGGSGSR